MNKEILLSIAKTMSSNEKIFDYLENLKKDKELLSFIDQTCFYSKDLEREFKECHNSDYKIIFFLSIVKKELDQKEKNLTSSDIIKKAFELMAESGSTEAKHRLGILLQKDKDSDKYEIMRLFKEAANEGYAPAMERVAYMLHYGIGTEPDCKQALKWYEKAANLGNLISQERAGYMYVSGQGTKMNIEKAIKYYTMAVHNDNDAGEENDKAKDAAIMGLFIFSDKDIEKNDTQVQNYFNRINEDEDIGCFLKCVREIQQAITNGDEDKLDELYSKYIDMAEKGDPYCQFLIAHLSFVIKEYEDAYKWAKIAAKNNFTFTSDACYIAGYINYMGLGKEQDINLAKKYLKKSAKQGNERAIRLLKEINSEIKQ